MLPEENFGEKSKKVVKPEISSRLFSSRRERRLWLLTLTVLVAIYASLGIAPTIVAFLRQHNLLRVSITIVAILIVSALAWNWVKNRPGWSEIGVAIGVALAYGMTFLRIENPAERTHLLEYGVVAAFIHQALLERRENGRYVPMPATLTVVATALLGLLDEGIQFLLPNRFFDWNDVFFNAFAGFMVIVARLALAPVKGPGWRLWFLWFMVGAIGWGWSMDPSSFGEGRTFEFVYFVDTLTIPPYPSVAVGAMGVGVLHSLLLRRYLARSFEWMLASLASAAIGAVVVWIANLFEPDLGFIWGVALHGTLAGLTHWLVLRRQLGQAGWWIVTSTVGWLVAIPLGDMGGPPGWAVYGAVTGAVLVWLLRRRGSGFYNA